MSKKHKNPPVIEIAVDMFWKIDVAAISAEIQDVFYKKFAQLVHSSGYSIVERVNAVSGDVSLAKKPVYMISKPEGHTEPIAYGIGNGILSTRALPPYESWESFSPEVLNGLDAYLFAWEAGAPAPLLEKISVRYVDAFDPHHTSGMDFNVFTEDVLRFRTSLPVEILNHMDDSQKPIIYYQIQVPLKDRKVMYLTLCEGKVAGRSSYSHIMDMTVSAFNVNADRKSVESVINDIHAVIYNVFSKLTAPISKTFE